MSMNSSCSNSGGGGCGVGPCGACKFLRRKCVPGCVFAPYFDSEQGAAHFAAVHKVFGASNVSKLLLNLPEQKRLDAVITICYEAQARMRDPVYGCVAHIFALQQQVVSLQGELSYLQGQLATIELHQRPPPSPPQATIAPPLPPPLFSIANLPLAPASNMQVAYDLSSLFEPMGQSSSWHMHHRPVDSHQCFGSATSSGGGGDLQALAHELLHRHGSAPVACSNASSSYSLSK